MNCWCGEEIILPYKFGNGGLCKEHAIRAGMISECEGLKCDQCGAKNGTSFAGGGKVMLSRVLKNVLCQKCGREYATKLLTEKPRRLKVVDERQMSLPL